MFEGHFDNYDLFYIPGIGKFLQ